MLQFLANGLCKGATYALAALGFGLIYTTTGVFHIAHGAVYVAAAYVFYFASIVLGLPLFPAILLALTAAALLGLAMELLVYRPLDRRDASRMGLMISSIGAYIVVINVIAMLVGNEARVLRSGVESTVRVGSAILTLVQVGQVAISSTTILFYWIFLRSASLGQNCRAVADDATLASILGIRVARTRLSVFAIGSFLAGLASILMALDVGVDPYVGFPIVMVAAVACIVGGLHRFLAPAVGGVLLGIIQSLVVWKVSGRWEASVTLAILLAFLVLRPQGLFGVRRRLEER
jgi:branched-chain amino acid transport system permease protein